VNSMTLFAARAIFFAATVLAGATFWSPPAQATTMTPLTIEQMTDASDLVVRAEVTQVWVEEDERGNLRTRAQLEVETVIKGQRSVDAVLVDQVGGVLHNQFAPVPFAARFSDGERGIFFLEHTSTGRTTIVGWSQGKYTLRTQPDSGAEMVVRYTVSQDRPYDHRFIPHPPAHQQVLAQDLVDRIQARVDTGWDGRPIPGVDPARLGQINKLQPGVNR
jgi:hypothetical protein